MTETKKTPKNRFYWLEGVSRSEVEKSLADRRPSRLRDQGPRRVLVLTSALVMAALVFTIFITQNKLRTYSEAVLMVLGLVLYFQLRKAVRLVSDAPDEVLAEQQAGRRDAAWVQEEVRKRYSAMNRPDVADGVKSFKGQMELLNPALVKGSFEQQVDVMRNMIMTVPEGLVGPIVGARLQNALIAPLNAPIVAGLQAVIDVQSRAAPAKPDVWTPRQFTIAPNARATEVGAVEKAGEETSFSTFGKTVVVHANGFEVESVLPGGDRVKFSSTSMASPQVANLAAKLFGLKPELAVAQVRQAIVDTSERKGRVNLVHPRLAAQKLGLRL
jgi:hypothetical protein